MEYSNFQKVKRLKIKDLSEYSVITDIRILTITLLRKKEIKYCKQRLVQSQLFIILQKKIKLLPEKYFVYIVIVVTMLRTVSINLSTGIKRMILF